jgi:dUTP pyrophosphatase
MKVKKLFNHSQLPHKAHAGDLGYDLFASEDAVIFAGDTKLVRTGIAIQFPEGYGGLLRDRSSVATKRRLFVVAGVIDNGYTGEILVALHNSTENGQVVKAGEKIAQLILVPTVDFSVEEVPEILSSDGRSDRGFGSTGT